MKVVSAILDIICEPPLLVCACFSWAVKVAVVAALGGAVGLVVGWGIDDEGRQIERGEISPHVGFCPDFPTWKGERGWRYEH